MTGRKSRSSWSPRCTSGATVKLFNAVDNEEAGRRKTSSCCCGCCFLLEEAVNKGLTLVSSEDLQPISLVCSSPGGADLLGSRTTQAADASVKSMLGAAPSSAEQKTKTHNVCLTLPTLTSR